MGKKQQIRCSADESGEIYQGESPYASSWQMLYLRQLERCWWHYGHCITYSPLGNCNMCGFLH